MRLIDADALLKLLIETLERIKENPKMTEQEVHIICATHMLADMVSDAKTIGYAQKWISVKERLPEEGDEVLISLCGCNVKQAKYRGNGIFDAAYVDSYHATGMGSIVLTHWMPLPEPAKEDAHETE